MSDNLLLAELLTCCSPSAATSCLHVQEIGLTCAGFVVIGFVAAISLLLRHWSAIERYHLAPPADDITAPLLQVSHARASSHCPSCCCGLMIATGAVLALRAAAQLAVTAKTEGARHSSCSRRWVRVHLFNIAVLASGKVLTSSYQLNQL